MPSVEVTRAPYRRTPVIVVVLAVVAALSALARIPNAPAGEMARMASRFRFSIQKLPLVPIPRRRCLSRSTRSRNKCSFTITR